MATALRPIGHEDRLSVVDHLDELRKRLIISAAALLLVFAVCFWQSDALLDVVNRPFEGAQAANAESAAANGGALQQSARFQRELGQALEAVGPALAGVSRSLEGLAAADGATAGARSAVAASQEAITDATRQIREAAAAVPTDTERRPVTLGVAEPFTVTLTIALYGALLLCMPILLYQAYAFILPAFSPRERKVALPLMAMVPVLFILGAAFAYFVVLERAITFLQGFNDDEFDILLQARDYYKFAVVFMAGIGLLFQIPVGVLAVTRLGIVTPRQLRKNRGYILLAIAVLAAIVTPTPDPVTMLLAMGPLILLFELSVLLASWINRTKPPPERDPSEDF